MAAKTALVAGLLRAGALGRSGNVICGVTRAREGACVRREGGGGAARGGATKQVHQKNWRGEEKCAEKVRWTV